jgi:hypothetical protein
VSGLPLDALGQHRVDAPILCNITRFGLRGARHLLPTYRDYRGVVRAALASGSPGLHRCAFLVENPTTCYSMSIWADGAAIAGFGTDVASHGDAARRIFGRLAFDSERGPELWSTRWRLEAVTHNLNWADFDLRSAISANA